LQNVVLNIFHDPFCPPARIEIECRFYLELTVQVQSGFFPKCYTFRRRPVKLVYFTAFTDFDLALKRMFQVKNWSQAKKEALIKDQLDQLPNLAKKDFTKASR
jgi:putative endonuclease